MQNKPPKAKKIFSQNFLTHKETLRKIANYGDIQPEDHILEIGPGTGELTQQILRHSNKLTLIEIDPDLARFLENQHFLKDKNITIINKDFLDSERQHYDKIFSNLPYKNAIPITFKIIERNFSKTVLVYQDKMAKRIAATPGTQKYGRISILTQRLCKIELLDLIPAKYFTPKPKVESRILRLIKRDKPQFKLESPNNFDHLIDFLFFHKELKLATVLSDYRLDLISKKLSKNPETNPLLCRKIWNFEGREIAEIEKIIREEIQKLPRPTTEQKRKRQKLIKNGFLLRHN